MIHATRPSCCGTGSSVLHAAEHGCILEARSLLADPPVEGLLGPALNNFEKILAETGSVPGDPAGPPGMRVLSLVRKWQAFPCSCDFCSHPRWAKVSAGPVLPQFVLPGKKLRDCFASIAQSSVCMSLVASTGRPFPLGTGLFISAFILGWFVSFSLTFENSV